MFICSLAYEALEASISFKEMRMPKLLFRFILQRRDLHVSKFMSMNNVQYTELRLSMYIHAQTSKNADYIANPQN